MEFRLFTVYLKHEREAAEREGKPGKSYSVVGVKDDAVLFDDGSGLEWCPLNLVGLGEVFRSVEERAWWSTLMPPTD